MKTRKRVMKHNPGILRNAMRVVDLAKNQAEKEFIEKCIAVRVKIEDGVVLMRPNAIVPQNAMLVRDIQGKITGYPFVAGG